eukprot:PLAT9938.1.p1 GENE.PLAT9938.1~~PLAT9938.1.p1  ORF type:complete len:356 (+),score=152.34 PLAT9938.1:338-1405(+)
MARENVDSAQIRMDIARSLWHFDIDKAMPTARRTVRRRVLSDMLNALFVSQPELHYYQGLHDVCSVLLRVCGGGLAFQLLQRLASGHLRDCMREDFAVVSQQLFLLPVLVSWADDEVGAFMRDSGVQPFVALPWLITWYAHHFASFSLVCRLYDLFLSTHPLMPIYFAAAIIISRRQQLLETECDFALVHKFLSDIPEQLAVEELALEARRMLAEMPPADLITRFVGSEDNVMRTTAEELMQSTAMAWPYDWMGARLPSSGSDAMRPARDRRRREKRSKRRGHRVVPVDGDVKEVEEDEEEGGHSSKQTQLMYIMFTLPLLVFSALVFGTSWLQAGGGGGGGVGGGGGGGGMLTD